MKDGTSIACYNVDEGTKYISYTLKKDELSDVKRISKLDVFAIKKDNEQDFIVLVDAKKESNDNNKANTAADTPNGLIDAIQAENNVELIRKYSTQYGGHKNKKSKNKGTNDIIIFYGVTSNSTLSSEDIEISFVPTMYSSYLNDKSLWNTAYKIQIYNKSLNTIYIDLANTSKSHNGNFIKSFYDGTSVSEHKGASSGASVNTGAITNALGIGGVVGTLANGIGFGGGNEKSVGSTYAQQRIMSIPPETHMSLPGEKMVINKDINTYFEYFHSYNLTTLNKNKDGVVKWKSMFYEEANTPETYKYFITYSTEPDFIDRFHFHYMQKRFWACQEPGAVWKLLMSQIGMITLSLVLLQLRINR